MDGLTIESVRKTMKAAFPNDVYNMISQEGQTFALILDYGEATGEPALVVATDIDRVKEVIVKSISDAPEGKGLFVSTHEGDMRFAPVAPDTAKAFAKALRSES